MSEYQYFEFQAIDRPLSKKQMAELRSYSTRARITPASFVNEYSWGNFKGDPDAWMEKYFDAFLYLANWGTRILKFRLPENLLRAKTARLYAVGEHAAARVKNGNVILSFCSEDESGEDSVESDGSLASLISLRPELAHRDLRALYVGWLACAQSGELDPDVPVPPIPPGLTKLSAPLASLVDFLRIDGALVRVSAKRAAKARTVNDLIRDRDHERTGKYAAAKGPILGILDRGKRRTRVSHLRIGGQGRNRTTDTRIFSPDPQTK